MKHNYSAVFKRVRLRPLEERDIEELRILRNKNQQYFNSTGEISSEQQKAWYEAYLAKDDDCTYAIELVDNPGVLIGMVAHYDIDWENGLATGGRTLIDKEKAPFKGLGTEMSNAGVSIAFFQMGLKELRCSVRKDNERALKMNMRGGYKIYGETADEWLLTLTEADWHRTLAADAVSEQT